MEKLDVFNCSNVFIASFFTDDRGCAHCNREHTLIYILSGKLEITDCGRKTLLHPGDCAFMRRENRMWLQKRASKNKPYRSIVIKFSRNFLKEFYQTINQRDIPSDSKREKVSLMKFPPNRPDVRTLFESLVPYFDEGRQPDEDMLRMKMNEGLRIILETDVNLYASLFDFVDPWKIDIVDFMENNYMNELSMEEMAYFTGRSLATFKRDFKKVSELTPQKWLIRRRLEAARDLIIKGSQKVSEICYDVGFKNLSHFSKLYKEMYGIAPTLFKV
ncbi:MAG: AraC family transcriptional regulator [Bacteroidales bacterium]|nr:AraC family transcriptional regulator [Bacteroidales bacterium]MBD5361157.1 AraC family transcriptional regulator [Bacteroides sp.]MBD5362127.1 AraC family transcriptional regulator [Bacteroides sp.]MBD5373438.1 AraC family transcriptional regulator [Bacteroides sp.]